MSTGPAPSPARRFLVVDDHPMYRRGLRALLVDEFGAEVDEAGNAGEALERLAERNYELAVVDVSLPGRNGVDLIEQVAEGPAAPRILVVSVHPESQYAIRAVRAGAAGYVAKDAPAEELCAALHRVLDGGRHLSPQLAERLGSLRAERRSLHDGLSDREMEVLCLIGRGLTVSQIGAQLRLSVKTISTYRSRILEKTSMRTNAELMRYALDHALVP